jgi:hypothetical protein
MAWEAAGISIMFIIPVDVLRCLHLSDTMQLSASSSFSFLQLIISFFIPFSLSPAIFLFLQVPILTFSLYLMSIFSHLNFKPFVLI